MGSLPGQSILFDNKNELDDIIDSSSKLIINFTNNEIKITAKIPIIDSFDIDELASNPENKKHLWNSIKDFAQSLNVQSYSPSRRASTRVI
jgi:hypothetical protein